MRQTLNFGTFKYYSSKSINKFSWWTNDYENDIQFTYNNIIITYLTKQHWKILLAAHLEGNTIILSSSQMYCDPGFASVPHLQWWVIHFCSLALLDILA